MLPYSLELQLGAVAILVIFGTGRSVLMEMAFINTRGDKCVALQID